MYWIMLSERSDEYELSIDSTPPILEENEWQFDVGELESRQIPVIDIPVEIHPEEIMVDNIPAYGCRGLLINRKVKDVFDNMSLKNIHYYPARLINRDEISGPFWIANIIGKHASIDHDASDLDYFDDGGIEFIDKLVLKSMKEEAYGHIFRLAEFLPVILVSDALKVALELSAVTGFTFYKPEEFSL